MLSPAHLAKQLMQKQGVGNKGATKKPQPFDMSEEGHSEKAKLLFRSLELLAGDIARFQMLD